MNPGTARCVCGRSQRFPLCDGSHRGEGWTCDTDALPAPLAVLAGPHLESLGERLAHAEGGVVVRSASHRLRAHRAVLLSDGTDLAILRPLIDAVDSDERIAIAVDCPASALSHSVPGWGLREARPADPLQLWRAVHTALGRASEAGGPLLSAFLSHAVGDEPLLQPALDYLREQVGARIFACGDSIPPGADWRNDILAALEDRDVFVSIVSEASTGSTYCAFETGWALARGKPMRAISIDGTRPPPFAAHLQAADLPRVRRARPWLSEADALVDALLAALEADGPTPSPDAQRAQP